MTQPAVVRQAAISLWTLTGGHLSQPRGRVGVPARPGRPFEPCVGGYQSAEGAGLAFGRKGGNLGVRRSSMLGYLSAK